MNEIRSCNEETIAEFQKALMISPFHRWLGLKAVMVAREQIEIALPWREEFVANTAIEATHGGILAALIDLTGLYAVRAAGGIVSATADLRVDYHRPATRGTILAKRLLPICPLRFARKSSQTRCGLANASIIAASARSNSS